MTTFWKLLKPAPFIERIQDPQKIKSDYNYWRLRILYSMFIGYALYYFTRKSFTFAMPGLMADLHFDKSELGMLGSILSISYGLSKFASGVVSDRTNPRYFMAIGLMITGVLNICFGLSSSLFMFAIFWGLNGWFQGFGWPPCARFLTHWYSHSERGSWWSSFNVSHNVGAFTIFWVVGAALYWFNDDWRFAMYVPGVICILGGLFLINRLRDTPQSLGLPPIEEYRQDYAGSNLGANGAEVELTSREILVDYVLKNKYMWILAFSSLFVYCVRTGINDWTIPFLMETKGFSQLNAIGCLSVVEIGGFVGNLAAGWASDYLFGARRGPVNVLFAVSLFCSMLLFWFSPPGYPWFDYIAMFMLGFSVFGPQMLIGVAAAELSHKKAAASATGFAGTFAYMGAALAGYPLGKIIQDYGWEGFFWALSSCAVASILLLLLTWSATENPRLMAIKAKAEVGAKKAVAA